MFKLILKLYQINILKIDIFSACVHNPSKNILTNQNHLRWGTLYLINIIFFSAVTYNRPSTAH